MGGFWATIGLLFAVRLVSGAPVTPALETALAEKVRAYPLSALADGTRHLNAGKAVREILGERYQIRPGLRRVRPRN